MSAITRRRFLEYGAGAGAGMVLWRFGRGQAFAAPIPGGTLDPARIPKYETPLVIPPAMPRTASSPRQGDKSVDYYEIAVRQFQQQILPPTWACRRRPCGATARSTTPARSTTRRSPSRRSGAAPVRVKWINGLVDANGSFLPHLLPVDPTLHWANPPGGPPDATRPRHSSRRPTPGRCRS